MSVSTAAARAGQPVSRVVRLGVLLPHQLVSRGGLWDSPDNGEWDGEEMAAADVEQVAS